MQKTRKQVFLEQWFTLSESGMEEAFFDTPLYGEFAQLDEFSRPPDESTILRFRHRLEENKIAEQIRSVVHAKNQTTVHQLFVNVDGRGGHEQAHGAFNLVFVGEQVARGGIGAGGGNGEFALRLQEFQGIRQGVLRLRKKSPPRVELVLAC